MEPSSSTGSLETSPDGVHVTKGDPGRLWSKELVTTAESIVTFLHSCHPSELWMVCRTDSETATGHVVVAAAGPLSSTYPGGAAVPMGRPRGVGARPGSRTELCVPLTVEDVTAGMVYGVVAAEDDVPPHLHSLTQLLGALLSAALAAMRDKVAADELALVDSLTGLRNRRGWMLSLDRQAGRRPRPGGPTGVVVIDLDGMKAVNDTFGHTAGDKLLVELAGVLRRACRPDDVVARTGGDEFAILAVGADPEALSARVEHQLREARITASVAAVVHDPSSTWRRTWALADRAMYLVKATRPGRHPRIPPPPGHDVGLSTICTFLAERGATRQ